MIQPNFGVVSCAKLQKSDSKIRVECPFKDLEEVKKPISISATAFLLSKENRGDKVAVKAKVVFTLVYLSEDGYKKTTCDVDGVSEITLENAESEITKITKSDTKVFLRTKKFFIKVY